MPSIFSRSRTNSTPKRPTDSPFDEFGRITSRGSARGLTASPQSTSKKEKRKDSKEKSRSKASPTEYDVPEIAIPDGTFLPLNFDPPRVEVTGESNEPRTSNNDYGHLSYGRHVVLGLEQVARLVDVVGNELGMRGLTTPFIFSTLALDVSANAVRRLIQAFLRTCSKPSNEADWQWREEARLAGPHELGMCLRWGLARVVRIMGGQEVRGLVAYESYLEWRDAEAGAYVVAESLYAFRHKFLTATALNYPERHFAALVAPLQPILRSIIVGLLSLLTRFTAHSASSGHTPPTLSPLFGPLLFGLGLSTLTFHQAYMYYLRATTATEHLILAFIRWQDASGAGVSGIPTRLKAWIQGYPATLPEAGKFDRRPEPRRGARTVRVMSVRRNVRMYSPDLVKSAAAWAQGQRGATASSSMGGRAFAGSKEWERISPPTLKLPPRYSDAYKKRMDLPPNFHPDSGTSSASSTISAPSLSSSVSTASSITIDEKEHGFLGTRAGEDRFRSLTDLKWGEFEIMGFGDLGADEKKLQFDLTEGARAARAAKRSTLSWQDFSSAGFSRSDAPLNATLQFSTPVTNTVNAWPLHSVEIHRKLKKTQKSLPVFGWDIEPVLGSEEVIEEAFVDVFCDLVYGGGWMDIERCEEVDRDCNWALIEFKSLPVSKTNTVSGTTDPRTSTTLVLFEEFVPLEYRQQLATSGTRRRRLPSLFGTSSKSKQWKQAPTLNGRPYVVGHVPISPSYREVEFEGLLRDNGSATKIISLNQGRLSPSPSNQATPGHSQLPIPPANNSQLLAPPVPKLRLNTQTPPPIPNRAKHREETASPSPMHRRHSRFRLPTGLPVSPGSSRRLPFPPAEYESVDFDARLASFSDDELNIGLDKHHRRRSKDDAWVDILVANNNRRMQSQEVDMRNGHKLRSRRSDPELASQEVSEVLAAMRGQTPSDEEDEGMEPVDGPSDFGRETEDDSRTIEESILERGHASVPERDSALYGGDDEDDEPVVMPTRTKRLGYFDMHPDRRPKNDSDQPQIRLERTSMDSDAFSQDDRMDAPSSSSTPRIDDISSTFPSDADGDSQVTPSASQVDLSDASNPGEVRRFALGGAASASSANIQSQPTENQSLLPPASSSSSLKPTASRTASLIEMYRERERSATAPGPASASRLPVRSASLQPPGSVPLALRPGVQPAATPEITDTEPEESDIDPELVLNPPEPNLPIRYIHGAPLHNVLEEEEED
ncbi:uncharacterized protein FIBRA_02255 [Fibroporia radiculosa]|uniref:Meiotically up-regulated protein Msb1/Mug8 domain-containing protein n=1 Tax=Fibroporia radiculosa TaxID=599839 RepID=J4HUL9_9APHY|nr:uncharacterized protein FIBRA_02255 [Fibroporia radiculosa]CCM00227.1 predicted protein [Fibroporia radiculosa]